MLESVLPGLRDVRAPLAAGYLWLAAIWLAVHDEVPASQEEATGIWEPVFRLGDAGSVFGIGIALSFGAYLVGILTRILVAPFRTADYMLFSGRIVIVDDVPPDEDEGGRWAREPSHSVAGPHLSFRSWWSLDLMARKAISDIRKTLPDKASEVRARTGSDNEPDGAAKTASEFDPDAFVNDSIANVTSGFHDWSKVYASAGLLPTFRWAVFFHLRRFSNWLRRFPTQHFQYSERTIVEISTWLSLELDSVKNRLLTLDKDQFDLVDRLEAESEFRFQLIPPLIAMVVLLALDVSPWWLFGLIGVGALFRGAITRESLADDAIVDRLFAGDVKAPLLERLERDVSSAMASSRLPTN